MLEEKLESEGPKVGDGSGRGRIENGSLLRTARDRFRSNNPLVDWVRAQQTLPVFIPLLTSTM